MKVLVTGGAGFIGSHVVDMLVNKGHEVFSIDDMSGGFWRNINPSCKFEKINLVDKEKTSEFVKKIQPEIIFHLAADATEGRSQFTPINCTERNYNAFLHTLVPAIKTKRLKRFVAISSMSIYGAQKPPFSEEMRPCPEDIYGVSKTAMEETLKILADVYGFEYCIMRPHNVYGIRQNIADPYRNVIGIFINQLLGGRKYYIYGDGKQKRAFSHINDVAPYIVMAGFSKNCKNEVFNVGPSEEYSINHVSGLILKSFFGSLDKVPENQKPEHIPDRPKEVKNAYCTNSKIVKIMGYKTSIGLEDGIGEMIDWAKNLGYQKPRYLHELEIENQLTPKTWKEKLL
jgi:UDP-glucose 4-epimerase